MDVSASAYFVTGPSNDGSRNEDTGGLVMSAVISYPVYVRRPTDRPRGADPRTPLSWPRRV